MRKASIFYVVILWAGVAIGCAHAGNNNEATDTNGGNSPTSSPVDDVGSENQMTVEELVRIYEDNKKIINNIKEGLFSSKYKDIGFYYMEDALLAIDDPNGKKLDSIQNIKNDIIAFLNCLDEELRSTIAIRSRKVLEDRIVEFYFYDSATNIEAGIVYTAIPDELGSFWEEESTNIEGNWYAYREYLEFINPDE